MNHKEHHHSFDIVFLSILSFFGKIFYRLMGIKKKKD